VLPGYLSIWVVTGRFFALTIHFSFFDFSVMFGALGLQHPKLWPTRSDNNTAQDYSVLDTAFVLIDAISPAIGS
jgi:hypothetical protein